MPALRCFRNKAGFRKFREIDTRAGFKKPAEVCRICKPQISGHLFGRLVGEVKVPFCLQNDPALDQFRRRGIMVKAEQVSKGFWTFVQGLGIELDLMLSPE